MLLIHFAHTRLHFSLYSDALAIEDPCDREAFTPGAPVSLSFAQARVRVRALASAFVARGLKKGDVIVVQLPNIHELAVACLACANIGCVVSTVKMQFKAHSLRMYMTKAKAKAFVGTTSYAAGMGPDVHPLSTESGLLPVLEELGVATVFCVGGAMPDAGTTEALGDKLVDVAAIFAAWEGPRQGGGRLDYHLESYRAANVVTVNDHYNCAWSSGSTGEAKGILHTHGEVVAFAQTYFDMFEISPADSYKATLHVAPGDSWLMLGTWVCYGGVLLYCDLRPSEVGWKAFFPALARTTWCLFIPGIYDVILTYMAAPMKHMDLSRVKNWGTVSAAMPAKIATALKAEFGIDICNLYACNEGPQLFNSPRVGPPEAAKRCTMFPAIGFPGSKWPNPHGVRTKIVDRGDGRELTAVGSVGFLTARTASTCSRFVCELDDAVNWPFDAEGYLNANDVFRVVAGEDGAPKWFEMLGRERDILRIMGMDYAPTLIEGVMADHAKVKDVAACALPRSALSVTPGGCAEATTRCGSSSRRRRRLRRRRRARMKAKAARAGARDRRPHRSRTRRPGPSPRRTGGCRGRCGPAACVS